MTPGLPFSLIASALMNACLLFASDQADLDALRSRAAGGEGKAQLDLAFRYRDGKVLTKDNAEAMKWAHLAADGGNAEAKDFVGSAYLRGAVTERKPVIALGYFKAAAAKSPQAAFNLGQCDFGAQGTEQDIPTALEYWKKAANAGHGRAAACAAMAYFSGEGIPPDPVQARRLAERAADLNDLSGLVVLGEMQFQGGESSGILPSPLPASNSSPLRI